MSTIDPSLSAPILPSFPPVPPTDADSTAPQQESPTTAALIAALRLQPHPEGGYFVETDRDTRLVPNPFVHDRSLRATAARDDPDTGFVHLGFAEGARALVPAAAAGQGAPEKGGAERVFGRDEVEGGGLPKQLRGVVTRAASTSIYYLLTEKRSVGRWHRNKGRTVHTLHKGRGRYVVVHADEVAEGESGHCRVETFVVGQDVARGERLQWVVEGGKYKASFLLPDVEGGEESREGLLISETVIPGFDFADHDFLKPQRLPEIVTHEQAQELAWLLRKGE